jgi:hypothetical protein
MPTTAKVDFDSVVPHITGGLYEGRSLDEAVRRYERVWIPLLRKYVETYGAKKADLPCKVTFIPPLDVAYIWHVHRLDPNYPDYCRQALGRLAIPQQPFAFATTPDTIMWDADEPFYPPQQLGGIGGHAARRPVVDSSLEPHLHKAVKRQASFGHMFLRLCYQDRAYLELVRPRSLLVPDCVPSLPQPVAETLHWQGGDVALLRSHRQMQVAKQ